MNDAADGGGRLSATANHLRNSTGLETLCCASIKLVASFSRLHTVAECFLMLPEVPFLGHFALWQIACPTGQGVVLIFIPAGGGGLPLGPPPSLPWTPSSPPPSTLIHLRIRVLGTFFRLGQFFPPAPSAHL